MSWKTILCSACLYLCLAFFSPLFAQDMSVQAFTLHYRHANDLIPMLQPLLPTGSVVTGDGYNLLIKTTADGFSQINPIIANLDQRPQSLVLRVRRSSSNTLDTAIASDGKNTAYSSDSAANTDQEQRVTVQDGQSAFVETGDSFPYHDYTISLFGIGQTTQYKDLKTGVILTPHLAGGKVQVNVQWNFAQLQRDGTAWEEQNSNITSEKTGTMVDVPLGQWVNISGSSSQSLQQEKSTTLSTYNTQHPTANLFISVEKAP